MPFGAPQRQHPCGHHMALPFLLALNYAWITAGHPNPTMYHLERLARIIFERRSMMPAICGLEKMQNANAPSTSPVNLPLFRDFCLLPQDDLA
eukprot:9997844-Karenia_brevis.AAC.1